MVNRFVLNETSYHGAGAIKSIADEAKGRAFKKAFVCSDPDLVKFGVTQKVLDVLDGAGEGYVSQDNMADTASAEAVMALTSLGYSAADATRAVRMVENVQSMDSEAILKAALKKLAFM